jgi:uncharacterized protein (DUF2235 family)
MGKRIIVCCDGTWNEPERMQDDDEGYTAVTNVMKIARAIEKHDGNKEQIVFYLNGIGTSGGWLDRKIDGATGRGISGNIVEAYQFIALNFDDLSRGDELFLFGFSRGAYTVRSLAGFMDEVGVVKKERLDQLQVAYDLYQNKRGSGYWRRFLEIMKDIREPGPEDEEKRPLPIKFIGVWDTVGALGNPIFKGTSGVRIGFHSTELCKNIDYAYQALALHELRPNFRPAFWTKLANPSSEIEQVWFAGAHADVGGGYKKHGLSDYALEWMAQRAQSAGLAINWSALENTKRFKPDEKQKIKFSREGIFRVTRAKVRPIRIEAIDPYLQKHFPPTLGNPQPAGMEDNVKKKIFVHPSAKARIQDWCATGKAENYLCHNTGLTRWDGSKFKTVDEDTCTLPIWLPPTRNWQAWQNRRPFGESTLDVFGEVETSNSNQTPLLEEAVTQGIDPDILFLDLSITTAGTDATAMGWKAVTFPKRNSATRYTSVEIHSGGRHVETVNVVLS